MVVKPLPGPIRGAMLAFIAQISLLVWEEEGAVVMPLAAQSWQLAALVAAILSDCRNSWPEQPFYMSRCQPAFIWCRRSATH